MEEHVEEKESKLNKFCIMSRGTIVQTSDDEFAQWCAPWKGSLVVHVWGTQVGFKMLEYKLQKDWAKVTKICIVNMPDGFFLVQFTTIDYYKCALFNGSWMVANHYLFVHR